jgi:hypothetical protein
LCTDVLLQRCVLTARRAFAISCRTPAILMWLAGAPDSGRGSCPLPALFRGLPLALLGGRSSGTFWGEGGGGGPGKRGASQKIQRRPVEAGEAQTAQPWDRWRTKRGSSRSGLGLGLRGVPQLRNVGMSTASFCNGLGARNGVRENLVAGEVFANTGISRVSGPEALAELRRTARLEQLAPRIRQQASETKSKPASRRTPL